jgi:hypothetical protein
MRISVPRFRAFCNGAHHLFCLNFIFLLWPLLKAKRMIKNLLILILGLHVANTIHAQGSTFNDFKAPGELNLQFLEKEPTINLIFLYDDLRIDGVLEDDYMAKQMEKNEKDGLGKGQEWQEVWLGNRKNHYEPEFIKGMQNKLKKVVVDIGFYPESKYTIVVHVYYIETGWFAGYSSIDASVNMNIHIIETANTNISLANLNTRATGTTTFGLPTLQLRVTKAFGEAGAYLGHNVLYKRAYAIKKK